MSVFEHTEFFSDTFARSDSFVNRIEARTKLAFTAAALVVNLISPGVLAPLALAIFSFVILLGNRVPLKLLAIRMLMPIIMAAVVLIMQTFLFGGTPLFSVNIAGLSFTGYADGFARGLLTAARVMGGVSAVLLLSMTTSADRLLVAAAWFKIPKTFIQIALLVYRYIFVLFEEFMTVRNAQRVRLGYCGWSGSMGCANTLAASLILRAYDRADRVFEAMLVRGFGTAKTEYYHELTPADAAVAVCLTFVLVSLYFVGRVV